MDKVIPAVRAKFKCSVVSKKVNWNRTPENPFLYEVVMEPVMGGSEENKKFWKYTPSGSLKMASILSDAFEPGKEYYLDFMEAVKD